MLAWLSVWSEVQTCIWPSWCHCHSLSLASVKSRLILPFWYRPTWVVPDKGPLNGCVCLFVYLYFPVLFCLSVSVKWLAVKTASEMTYIVSSGALNSTPTKSGSRVHDLRVSFFFSRCVFIAHVITVFLIHCSGCFGAAVQLTSVDCRTLCPIINVDVAVSLTHTLLLTR